MDSQHNVGIRIGGDASGVVGASRQAAEAQKGLGDQFSKTGEQAKRAADESKRFVERLKEEAETLGKGRSEIERYRAGQLQLTEAQKKSTDASLAQIAAYERKQQALQFVARAAALATVAATAYGASVVLGVKAAIDNAAALRNLSQSYGISTETLSAYRYQMSLAGVGQEEFSMGMKTLSKNISEAKGGVGDGAALFGLLGKQIQSAVQSGASIEQLLPMIADKFASFADGPNKAALAVALFGRAGEQLIPELNKGAAGFREAAKEAEKFGLIIGTDMARRADEFNSNLARMNALLGASKLAIAEEALPALNAVIEAFIRGTREGGLFTGALAAAREAAAQGFQPTQGELQQRLSRANALLSGLERQGVSASESGLIGDNYRSLLQTRTSIQAQLAATRGDAEAERLKRWQRDFDEQQRRLQPGAPALPKTGAGGPRDYKRLTAEINALVGALEAEAAATEKLTQADHMREQILAAVGAGTIKLTDEQYVEIDAALESARQAELQVREKEKLKQALEEGTKAYQQSAEAAFREAAQAADANRKLSEQNAEIGLTTEQLGALKIARAEDALAILRQEQALDSLRDREDAYSLILAERIRQAEEFVRLTREGASRASAAEQSKKFAEDFKQTSESINHSLTDALMRGFESGKGFARNFRDSLVNMFKTLVLEPTIRAVLAPVSQGITGATMSMLGTGASVASGGANLLSGGSSLANLFSGGMTNVAGAADVLMSGGGLGWAGTTLMGGNMGLAAAGGAMDMGIGLGAVAEGFGAGGAAGLGAAGMGAMSAIPYVGIALAALYAMGAFDDSSGPAQRGLNYSALLGSTNRASDNYPNYPWQTQWGSADMGPAQGNFQAAMAAQEQSLITRLKLSPDQISNVNAALAAGPNQQWFNAGIEGTPVEQSGAFQQIQASRLETISKALGRSVEELTQTLSTSDDAWAQSIAKIREALQSGLDPLGYWTKQAEALRTELGSSATTLDQWRSELLGALDGLSAEQVARWQALGTALEQSAQARDRQLQIEEQARQEAERAAQEAARTAEELRQAAAARQSTRESLQSGIDPAGFWGARASSLRGELGSSASTLEQWRVQFLDAFDSLSDDQIARWQALGDALDQVAQARDRQMAIEEQAREQADRAAQDAAQAVAERERSIAGLQSTLSQREGSLGQAVAGLPGQLGITSLEEFRRSLAISESASPLDRLSAAGRYYADTLAGARAGDLSSVLSFGSRAQDYLSIGREAYASGGDFQAIFSEVSRSSAELIQKQRTLEIEIAQSVPVAIRETGNDTVTALKRGFADTVSEIQGMRAELRRLEGA